MKTICIWLLVAMVSVLHGRGEELKKPVSKSTALKAIDLFCERPFTEDGRGAAAIIVTFAEESDEVNVKIFPEAVPWLGKVKTKEGPLLLAAYIAGNVRSQLEHKKKENDSYAGVLQVISTYELMQKEEPDFKLEDVEKFKELKSKNELKKYLEEAEKKADKATKKQ